MREFTKIKKAISLAILGSIITMPALAFEEQETSEVERISVTGSRILREGAIAPSPVTVISGADLLNTGAINIGEALNELPALANTYSLANSGRFIGTAGLNILDLRNMGTDRTLVLVDGKRHVSSAAGSASVDTNTIPSSWVERVEIITGGASAVYGADAVTGVVNFILKKNIEGLDVSATKGFSEEGPYKNSKYTFSYGQNFGNDRGNAAFAVEYVEQNRFSSLDREQLRTPYTDLRNPNQTEENKDSLDFPDKIYTPNAGHYFINNAGVFSAGNDIYSFNRDGTPRKVFVGDNVDGIRCADCDVFNLGQFTDIQPKFDRLNLNFKVNYDVTDDHNVYFSAKYAKVEAEDQGQPAFGFFNSLNRIKRDNAFVGAELGQLMDDNGLVSISPNRMLTDLGVRIEEDERETKRFVVGAEGYLSDDWSYDVSAVYGVTDHTRVNLNNLIRANYANALDSVIDTNGNAVCRSAEARADGCVAVDILGFGAPSQAAADYINTTSVGSSKIEQTVVGGSVSNGALFDMPAGPVGFAAGLEYRKEESVTEEPENAIGTFFNALGEDKGSFNVREAFVELSVPLLTDLPLMEDLRIETAARFADYSTIGNATSWKAGLDWTVGYGLRIRSTYSEALRAPNIGEIFGAASETFFNVDDACRQENLDDLANKTTRASNCAALGIPVDFNSDYDSASIRGSQSGNKDIREEKSESTTIGFVYQPEFLEGASLTVDYWKIELTDAISSTGAQDIIDRCVDSETGIDNQYCNLITRDASTHEITLLQRSVLNLAGQEAAGIDFELGYDFELAGGNLKSTLIGTYLKERKTYPFQDDPSDFTENAGTTGESKWQANLLIGYTNGNWNGTWKTRYLQDVSLYTEQELEDNPNPSSLMSFPSYVVSDLTVGYNFDNGLSLKAGVDNLFNKDLPIGTSGTGSGSAGYDNIGRFYYTQISFSM
ncbi:TonB-dependent receptor domain-containing protein [Cognaticolwellia beringensis]|uniref:TonB-dependent receptor n=1 Tax=Cognaticolwellia beringensis TaxID=1967665 RepID=A0A222GCL3_9GAMM|nr:TonB-dependent receptor [Cognaticolwellia beringensis]ASP49618.1 TonB-dependent receptor [Cognaticolwellia beringensis]